jgi:hypothetical protein
VPYNERRGLSEKLPEIKILLLMSKKMPSLVSLPRINLKVLEECPYNERRGLSEKV